ncbi:hypothetical protein EV424DRAFT_719243 [Suillus variegatus]|nr:hypothetical protein EV424DRAFT_719243 [Suillus variegatus]
MLHLSSVFLCVRVHSDAIHLAFQFICIEVALCTMCRESTTWRLNGSEDSSYTIHVLHNWPMHIVSSTRWDQMGCEAYWHSSVYKGRQAEENSENSREADKHDEEGVKSCFGHMNIS